ncbi:VIT1/CCC1 transporter family protein [Octadecabacter sp.]|nr:VIT1/CCC1 transporter family protein [Octadecabacter sp.]
MNTQHTEHHNMSRIGWLRAVVLGANDGIVSTASIIVGVAAAAQGTGEVLLAGTAGLVAGAMSMAAGEYVSNNRTHLNDNRNRERALSLACFDSSSLARWDLSIRY